ncbi:MAG TPA: RsmE family RNA methyltransferase, partial [Aquella sp.]|nr:RsmE family RNA methyltransferase [Aquella sp.]
ATLKIIKINAPKPIPPIMTSLAIALIANDKMDLIIQKAVELGVNRIIPVYTERSARLVEERSSNRLNHWQNIIISSCSQCGQNLLPTIALPISINSLFENPEYDVKIIMNVPEKDCHARQSLTRNDDAQHSRACNDDLRGNDIFMSSSGKSSGSVIKQAILLVGPEGGFTDEEIKRAILHNYESLQLGNLIMRAETAAIAGLSVLNLYLRAWIPVCTGMTGYI